MFTIEIMPGVEKRWPIHEGLSTSGHPMLELDSTLNYFSVFCIFGLFYLV